MNITEKALQFASIAHASINQRRKYSGQPYIVHPIEVAELVREYDSNENTICAAYLHDSIEDVFPVDPEYSIEKIDKLFGAEIAKLVTELTDVYTRKAYPTFNRQKRHELEGERISTISNQAKNIKCADIIANTSDIMVQDPGFAVIYIKEKSKVAEGLFGAEPALYKRLTDQLTDYRAQLNIR